MVGFQFYLKIIWVKWAKTLNVPLMFLQTKKKYPFKKYPCCILKHAYLSKKKTLMNI